MAAVARKLSVYVRCILRRPEVRVMSALILAISGNDCVGLWKSKLQSKLLTFDLYRKVQVRLDYILYSLAA